MNGESQNCTDCNQDQAHSDTHDNLLRKLLDDPSQAQKRRLQTQQRLNTPTGCGL
jgi:hypothetical protein